MVTSNFIQPEIPTPPPPESIVLLAEKISLRAHLAIHVKDEKLRGIIAHIAESTRYISLEMAELHRKFAGTKNQFGEFQHELDLRANAILKERLQREASFSISQFASEELDKIAVLSNNGARYSVTADPLDGSSLVDANLAVGTIIGIHEGKIVIGDPEEGILSSSSGRETLVGAMYIVYGPLTTLIYTAGSGVHEFVLDHTGNFVLSKENLKLKEKGEIYSPGGNRNQWLPNHRAFIDALETEGYKLRYSGGLVPDANQLLTKEGGIFTYPALTDEKYRAGKLRLFFEEQPLALIFEEAGGKATNGTIDILDIVPQTLDQRCPFYIGSRHEVERATAYLARN